MLAPHSQDGTKLRGTADDLFGPRRDGEERRERSPVMGLSQRPAQRSAPSINNAPFNQPTDFDPLFERIGQEFDLNPQLLKAIAHKESRFNPQAQSPVGAQGLMQIMPGTARDPGYGVQGLQPGEDIFDPEVNLRIGAGLYRAYLDRFDGDHAKALAAYNWGIGNVQRIQDEFDVKRLNRETRDYVKTLAPIANQLDSGQGFVERIKDALGVGAQATQARGQEKRRGTAEDLFDSSEVEGQEHGQGLTDIAFEAAEKEEQESGGRATKRITGPWLRGFGLLDRGWAAIAETVLQYSNALDEILGTTPQEFFGIEYPNVAESVRDFFLRNAEGWERSAGPPRYEEVMPSSLREALEPERIYNVIGEGAPLMAGLIAATLANPKLGTAMMFGVESGFAFQEMEAWEINNQEEIDPTYKLVAGTAVGAFNAALERVGIGQVIRTARVPGGRSRLFQAALAGVVEGGTEALQEGTNILNQIGYSGDAEDAMKRLIHGFYAGTILGVSAASVTGGLQSISQPTQDPAVFISAEDGVPMFRVIRHGHPLEGQLVPLSQLQESDLSVPAFREQMLFQELTTRDGISNYQAEATLSLIRSRAKKQGVSVEDWIQENLITDQSGLQTESIAREGALFIRGLEGDSIGETLLSLGRVFLNNLTPEERGKFKGRGLDAENFAQQFAAFVSRGEGREKLTSLDSVFNEFKEWLGDAYLTEIGLDGESGMSAQKRNFFVDLLEDLYGDFTVEQQRTVWEKIWDRMDVEGRFRRLGAPDTGFHMKNRYNVQEYYTRQGIDLVRRVSRKLKRDKKRISQAILAAEDTVLMQEIVDSGDTALIHAAQDIRAYFDAALADLLHYGGVESGFVADMQARIEDRITRSLEGIEKKRKEDKLKSEDLEALQEMHELLSQLDTLEYVHIPLRAWFSQAFEGNAAAANRALKALVDQKRRTVRLRDLAEIKNEAGDPILDLENINLMEIIQSYSRRLGNDMSLLRIKEAAMREGMMKKGSPGRISQTGFRSAPPTAPILKGHTMNQLMYDWVQQATDPSAGIGRFRQALNLTKMGAFWNPLFLPMYDVLQGAMLGSISPMHPVKTWRSIRKALRDVIERNEDWYTAEINGRSSKPYSSPLQDTLKAFKSAYEGHLPTFIKDTFTGSVVDVGLSPLKALYQASWDMAWFLDSVVRQVTYQHAIDNLNMTPREAAQIAALAHGDYASVPADTRRWLNTIFFTPTFKISMGKFLTQSIQTWGNMAAGNASSSQAALAGAVFRSLGIMIAFDMMMLGMGWDRDHFGRRYFRVIEDPERGPKELVTTWSAPHNMFMKYINRAQDAWSPGTENPLAQFLGSFEWEIHPFYRVLKQVLIDNQSDTGRPIYYQSDPYHVQGLKMVWYAFSQWANVLTAIDDRHVIGQQGYEAVQREYGQFWAAIARTFTFQYQRDVAPLRMRRDYETIMRILGEETGTRGGLDKFMRGWTREEWLDLLNRAPRTSEWAQKEIERMLLRYNTEYWLEVNRGVKETGDVGELFSLDPEETDSIEGVY